MNFDPTPRLMVIDGNVLSITADCDGPGEPVGCIHEVTLRDGRTRVVPWEHYTAMTRRDFELWLKHGRPGRQGAGPLDSRQLEAMEREAA